MVLLIDPIIHGYLCGGWVFELLSFSHDHNAPDMECNGVLSTEEYRLLVENFQVM